MVRLQNSLKQLARINKMETEVHRNDKQIFSLPYLWHHPSSLLYYGPQGQQTTFFTESMKGTNRRWNISTNSVVNEAPLF